ncbi:uncharacterized protein LOC115066950 [Nannospalax galili]|uniref:uncharacterized protein LOC115066950 n=1 Tax=Nannospalax galili TaxID=1026970 RepID=UPI00111BD384|nr:uncharacterized protein LOC115066950 [Nannospalax galili]
MFQLCYPPAGSPGQSPLPLWPADTSSGQLLWTAEKCPERSWSMPSVGNDYSWLLKLILSCQSTFSLEFLCFSDSCLGGIRWLMSVGHPKVLLFYWATHSARSREPCYRYKYCGHCPHLTGLTPIGKELKLFQGENSVMYPGHSPQCLIPPYYDTHLAGESRILKELLRTPELWIPKSYKARKGQTAEQQLVPSSQPQAAVDLEVYLSTHAVTPLPRCILKAHWVETGRRKESQDPTTSLTFPRSHRSADSLLTEEEMQARQVSTADMTPSLHWEHVPLGSTMSVSCMDVFSLSPMPLSLQQ